MVELGDVVGSGPPEKRLQAIVAARMGRPPVMAHEQWPERRPESLPFLNENLAGPFISWKESIRIEADEPRRLRQHAFLRCDPDDTEGPPPGRQAADR